MTRQTNRQKAHPIHYRVLMEPVGVNLFFLAATPHSLQGGYRMIAVNRGNAVYNMDGEHAVAIYEAWSNTAKPTAPELQAAQGGYPTEILRNYLQLPRLDPRIPQLAHQIADREKTDYDRASALTTYLKTRFGYTLQLPQEVQRDPLANFLFERKEGHCEYFASSLAVMLRSLGIPSRVVNGFRGGEFNDLTSQYLIRESDAHAWVEAYFPGKGWVEFDPTPAGLGAGDSADGAHRPLPGCHVVLLAGVGGEL